MSTTPPPPPPPGGSAVPPPPPPPPVGPGGWSPVPPPPGYGGAPAGPGWGAAATTGWTPEADRPQRSGLALASMIVGLAGLLLCFVVVPSAVALILGLVAAKRIKASGGRLTGAGMARVGWITGLLGVLLGAGFIALAVSGALDDDEAGVFDLDPGDCFSIDEDTERIDSVTVVDCTEPHNAEALGGGELNEDRDRDYPADAELFAEIQPFCDELLRDDVDEAFVGEVFALPIAPDEDAWEVGGPYACIVVGAPDSLTSSVRG